MQGDFCTEIYKQFSDLFIIIIYYNTVKINFCKMLWKLLENYILNLPEYWSKEIGNCLHQDWFCSKTIMQVASTIIRPIKLTM